MSLNYIRGTQLYDDKKDNLSVAKVYEPLPFVAVTKCFW